MAVLTSEGVGGGVSSSSTAATVSAGTDASVVIISKELMVMKSRRCLSG